MGMEISKPITNFHAKYKGKQLEIAIKDHYKIVHSLARKYSVLGFSNEELISEGILGLMFALEKFDESQNVKFSTYAFYWIRGQILKFGDKFKSTQYTELPNVITDNEEGVFQNSKYHLNHTVKNISDETEHKFVQYEDKFDTEHIKEINSKVRVAVDLLSWREKIIIEQRWLGESKKTLADLAKELEVSQERIRQIEKNAISKLKEILRDHFGNIDAYFSIGQFFLMLNIQNC